MVESSEEQMRIDWFIKESVCSQQGLPWTICTHWPQQYCVVSNFSVTKVPELGGKVCSFFFNFVVTFYEM